MRNTFAYSFMVLSVVIILFSIMELISQCEQKPIYQPHYINQLTIDDTLFYVLIGFEYWEHTKTINLQPENGKIVLRQKHDSIAEGYMVVNNTPYHYDSCVSIVIFKHNRSIGYAYGRMVRSTCPPSGDYYFKLKYNLYYEKEKDF